MPAQGDEDASAPAVQPAQDALSTYRAKRSADSSPEPLGTVSPVPGRSFVVHKHAASHLHFDLRIEMDGVLKSWAVPRGPSYDMADKRLAVRVEDHPLEYGDFEGIIPKGNYGAGGIIVWDRGEWIALEDWREGLEKGKLLFELRGYKLHGKWTLVKIKKTEKEWLLIKERDAWVKSPGDQFNEASIISGLTVEQVKAGFSLGSALREAIAASGAPRSRVAPSSVKPMLAESGEEAFSRDGWLFELKLDGYRLLASKQAGEVTLTTRNGHDYTHVFPEVEKAMRLLPLDNVIIDGEVVVAGEDGLPSFAHLQRRGRLQNAMEIRRASIELPSTFYVFDFLAFEDFDLRPLPLVQRKAVLLSAIPKLGTIRALDHVPREGALFLEQVRKMKLEGIIAKDGASPYRAGRSSQWLKIKTDATADFVVVGFTEPKGSRGHFGALQLADYVDGKLAYVGRVGTGFDDSLLASIATLLSKIERQDAPCVGMVSAPGAAPLEREQIPDTKTTTWVEPRLVVEVMYREITPDGLLRHAKFARVRDDKAAAECVRQGWEVTGDVAGPSALASLEVGVTEQSPATEARGPRPEAPNENPAPGGMRPAAGPAPGEKRVAFSNLKKIYWPTEKYTKGDLIEYYRGVSRWLLPYLKNRPVVMTRFPDGIDGKQFYQKDAPEFAPDWIRTFPIWSEDTQRDIRYFVCNDEDSLLYIANLGSIPLHIWQSRVGTLEQPDWCVIDLDPKEAPFSDVIRCALVLRRLCESIALPSFVKTTGKTGLHIMVPLERNCTYEQSRTLGELLARVMLREVGDIATITRHVTKRGDKVYLDYLQNRHGQLIVSPFSVRPLPGASVSMPLHWDEVNQDLDPRNYTIRNAVDRMESLGKDPCAPVLSVRPRLEEVLGRLALLWKA